MPTFCERCQHEIRSPKATRFCSQPCYLAWQRDQAAAGILTRFWAKVKKTRTCWIWTGSTNRGYGQFTLTRQDGTKEIVRAHRFAWTVTRWTIPDNLSVLHKCDNPPCVNPNHLFLGDDADNLNDARQKGRLVDGRHLIKVDDDGIRDILANYVPRKNGKALAEKYGISLVSLCRIVNGTQRVNPMDRVFQRVPSVSIPIRGEVAS